MTTYVEELTLENWMVFRGRQTLRLGPKAYAVTARLEGDDERSNFLGKSALGEAVLYALTGWLNPEHRFDNTDGWVHRGEKEGGVRLRLSDGSRVERTKKVGKSAQLAYVAPDGSLAKQEEAQKLIYEAVGLSEMDLLMTCFCVQREAGFLVRSSGADIDEVFGSWLRLQKLDHAQALVGERYEGARSRTRALEDELSRVPPLDQDGDLAEKLAGTHALLVGSKAREAELEKRLAVSQQQFMLRVVVGEYEGIEAEGVRLRREYDALGHEELQEEVRRLEVKAGASYGRRVAFIESVRQARELAAGNFDGQCPVSREQCPVSAEIVAAKSRNKRLLREAEEQEKLLVKVQDDDRLALRLAKEKERSARLVEERLQSLRDNLERLHDRYQQALALPAPDDNTALVAALEAVREERRRLYGEMVVLEQRANDVQRRADRVGAVGPQLEAARKRERVLAASALVLRHTRRRITEEALREIQDGANDDLADLGVPISILLRWQREGRGLAKECDACGRAFPDSARVKQCECGAPRGPLMVSRLDCQLSARSGGAEDLAGLALFCSASRWLRAERASAWSMGFLDEVTASLDVAHNRALLRHLPRMLEQAGIVQALVVSHSSAVASALPGRIQITSDGVVSRAEVVA